MDITTKVFMNIKKQILLILVLMASSLNIQANWSSNIQTSNNQVRGATPAIGSQVQAQVQAAFNAAKLVNQARGATPVIGSQAQVQVQAVFNAAKKDYEMKQKAAGDALAIYEMKQKAAGDALAIMGQRHQELVKLGGVIPALCSRCSNSSLR